MNQEKRMDGRELMQNVVAGLTVSFVAISLGAAFGILSGRGAFAGMLSAAIIAFITSAFGGTRIQASGPTGPMTAVTAVIVAIAHDKIAQLLPGVAADHFINTTFLLAGLLLVVMAILRLGKFITYVPNVVISGFMNGIAIIIWLDQIRKLFGIGGIAPIGGSMNMNIAVAFACVVLAFGIPVITRRFMPRFASLLSATLLTIAIMTGVSAMFHLPIEHVALTTSIRSWSDVTALVASQWPSTWSWDIVRLAAPFAAQLAVLAYLDTLLTSLVIDKLTGEKTKQNKELFAQGLATGAIALVGGIPGAQATIRSVLIVKEKATMRLAGMLIGIFALIEMILFQDFINLIPQAVFSGILIKVGYDVFDWMPVRLYVKEWMKDSGQMIHQFFSRHDDEKIFVTNREFLMIAGTTFVTVVWDLNIAVGLFTAFFYVANKLLTTKNPMRDLQPVFETEGVQDEP